MIVAGRDVDGEGGRTAERERRGGERLRQPRLELAARLPVAVVAAAQAIAATASRSAAANHAVNRRR